MRNLSRTHLVPGPVLLLVLLLVAPGLAHAQSRPNIVWIIAEDMSAHFSSYRESGIQTPQVDRLAARGVQFTNAITMEIVPDTPPKTRYIESVSFSADAIPERSASRVG